MDQASRSFLLPSVAAIALATVGLAPAVGAGTVRTAERTSAQHDQSSSAITTIRTYSNLVVVDVVVTDAQGNPVHGLKASDFSLLENNKLQIIRNFEEHSEVPATDIKLAPEPKLPAGLFTNKTAAPVNGPVNVLLLDYLNTPMSAQPYLRAQLQEFLDKTPPGTRIAVFTLNTQLKMLHGFTSDMSALKELLASSKGQPDLSHIEQGKDTTLDSLTSGQGQEIADSVSRMEALDASARRNMQALYTLNGFNMLARYLVGIPGRKNVIWYSEGFPLDVEPDMDEADPNDSVVRNDDAVRQTDNLLTRAQVAVYPVDVRGVQGDPALDFGSPIMNQRAKAAIDAALGPAATGLSADKISNDIQDASVMTSLQEKAQEQETMMAMAEDTGGKAFMNTNNLAKAMTKVLEDGSNYYTLTYAPANVQWDARFRSIKVKVDQANLKLTYRNGYYALNPYDRNKLTAQGAATALLQPTTMAAAMMHGGPDPAEIPFKVRIRPADTPPSATPLPTNRTNPNPKVKVEGPYKAYGVDLVPDPKALNCRQEANGDRHCALEIWTYVYDGDGQLLITTGNRVYRALTPADYQKLLAGGLAFHQEISVPIKGEHFLRTAIYDINSDRVGAVEIPVEAVAKLEPLKPLPAVPAESLPGFSAGAGPDSSQPQPAGRNGPAQQGTGADATGSSVPPPASVPVTGTPVPAPVQNTSPPTLKRRPEPAATPPANPPTAPASSPN